MKAGCELYALQEGEGRFDFVEQTASEHVLAEHNRGPAITRTADGLGEHPDGAAEVIVTRPVAAREPSAGELHPA